MLQDPSTYTYYREEVGGLMLGLFEPAAAVWNPDSIPDNFIFGEIVPDWDRVGPHLERAYSRVPLTMDAGVRKLLCGPERFTPDLAPLVGETPELRNCFVACGMISLGILNGAGLGMVLAHWIVDGVPPIDVTGINVNRFTRSEATRAFRRDQTPELLGKLFGQHYPNQAPKTARHIKQSVLHDRLAQAGAYFTEGNGWEMPDWFAPSPDQAKIEAHSWFRQNWWNWHAEEHRTARDGVIVMDMSTMSKFIVDGPDACALLNRLSCNEVDAAPGRIVYTAWVNDCGGFEADLTVTRLAADRFMVVVGENAHGHTEMRLRRQMRTGEHVAIFDATPGTTQINIHGPKARDLMTKITQADMRNAAFPFMTAQEIDIGYWVVWAYRVTFIGELGWELHVPATQAVQVYDLITEAGREFGLRNAGMLQFLLHDPEPLLYGTEMIYLEGEAVGYIQIGGYGHSLGAAVRLGFVALSEPLTPQIVENGPRHLEIAGKRCAATAALKPLFDPDMLKVRS